MKPDCHPNERALYWTLLQDERTLLANKTAATRLGFALLLKLFQRDGRFPERREEIAENVVTYKEDAGAVKVETVLEEIEKLKHLRRLGLPEDLFRDVPAKLVTHYRQRAASEKPRDLRRHPPDIRYPLLAALCWHLMSLTGLASTSARIGDVQRASEFLRQTLTLGMAAQLKALVVAG